MAECGPNCEETLKEIERFLDGELDVLTEGQVTHHLSDCNPCMERTEFRKHVKLLVHEKCTEEALPPGLSDKIKDLLRTFDAPAGA
jgi:mycothiol system anti-sigma-R factor